jgi:hypothetical protein
MALTPRVVDTTFERIGFTQSAWGFVPALLTCLAVPLAPVLRLGARLSFTLPGRGEAAAARKTAS